MKDVIYKFALQNAVRYEGKANPGALIGKILAEDASLKSKMKAMMHLTAQSKIEQAFSSREKLYSQAIIIEGALKLQERI